MFESCGVQAEEGISEANLSNADLAVANLKSNDAQTQSAPPAQGNTPTPDTSGSSGASSSQPGPES